MSDTLSNSVASHEVRDAAIGWMNRAHELMQLGDPASLASALDAYGEAIRLFRTLSVSENPSWANSLGAAYMNRGQLLHRLHGVDQAAAALESLRDAVALLRPLAGSTNPWPRRNLAGTLLNRANLLLDLNQPGPAVGDAREALLLSDAFARDEIVDADLALKSRRALCDALGRIIAAPSADPREIASIASDLVDEALELIRLWNGRGASAFQELGARFFRYGAQLYRVHQPHFLAEFIGENLSVAPDETPAIAREVIAATLAEQSRGDFFLAGDAASERRLRLCRDLETLRDTLPT